MKLMLSQFSSKKTKLGFSFLNVREKNSPSVAGFTLRNAKQSQTQFGFTLIELLVVVAIIAILISIGAASYSTTLKRGRDAQRKADLKKIQSALQAFYSDNTAYPDEHGDDALKIDSFTCSTSGSGGTPLKAGDAFTCDGKTYLGKIPGDPKDGHSYFYEINQDPDMGPTPAWCDKPYTSGVPDEHGNCQKYTLWAKLENPNDSEVFKPGDPSADPQCQIAWNIEDWLRDAAYTFNYCVHQ